MSSSYSFCKSNKIILDESLRDFVKFFSFDLGSKKSEGKDFGLNIILSILLYNYFFVFIFKGFKITFPKLKFKDGDDEPFIESFIDYYLFYLI